MFKRWLLRAGKRPWKAKKEKFHTCGGPRRRPCLGQGRGRRICIYTYVYYKNYIRMYTIYIYIRMYTIYVQLSLCSWKMIQCGRSLLGSRSLADGWPGPSRHRSRVALLVQWRIWVPVGFDHFGHCGDQLPLLCFWICPGSPSLFFENPEVCNPGCPAVLFHLVPFAKPWGRAQGPVS